MIRDCEWLWAQTNCIQGWRFWTNRNYPQLIVHLYVAIAVLSIFLCKFFIWWWQIRLAKCIGNVHAYCVWWFGYVKADLLCKIDFLKKKRVNKNTHRFPDVIVPHCCLLVTWNPVGMHSYNVLRSIVSVFPVFSYTRILHNYVTCVFWKHWEAGTREGFVFWEIFIFKVFSAANFLGLQEVCRKAYLLFFMEGMIWSQTFLRAAIINFL